MKVVKVLFAIAVCGLVLGIHGCQRTTEESKVNESGASNSLSADDLPKRGVRVKIDESKVKNAIVDEMKSEFRHDGFEPKLKNLMNFKFVVINYSSEGSAEELLVRFSAMLPVNHSHRLYPHQCEAQVLLEETEGTVFETHTACELIEED